MQFKTENIGNYIARFIGTTVLCCIMAYVLYMLSAFVIGVVCKVICSLKSPIDFSSSEVADDMMMNSIIPGLGTLHASFSDPNMSGRMALLVGTIIVAIGLAIVYGLYYLMNKVVEENKVLTVFSGLILTAGFFLSFYISYFTPMFDIMGIDKGFWFYVVSIIVMLIHAFIIWAVISILWNN